MAGKNEKAKRGYLTGREIREIAKANAKEIRRLEAYKNRKAPESEFTTEMMYGSVGFYAKRNGNTELLCRFISGRNLPRYSVVIKGCEMLAKRAKGELPTSDEPERYCPKCGRPYLLSALLISQR